MVAKVIYCWPSTVNIHLIPVKSITIIYYHIYLSYIFIIYIIIYYHPIIIDDPILSDHLWIFGGVEALGWSPRHSEADQGRVEPFTARWIFWEFQGPNSWGQGQNWGFFWWNLRFQHLVVCWFRTQPVDILKLLKSFVVYKYIHSYNL